LYRVAIFNDSKWRDSPGSVFIKHELHKNNPGKFDVRIISYHLWEQVLNYFNPHVVMLNHAQGGRSLTIASKVRRNGGKALVLFNEGIVEFEQKAEIFRQQRGARDIEEFLCWNDITAEMVGGVTVGCPRFDIYGKYKGLIDYKGLFCDKHGLDNEKPIVLWADSWPSAKFAYSLQNFHRSNWNDLKNTVADKWEDPDEFAKGQFIALEKFKADIVSTKYLFPHVQMVVKSHPMSDRIRWETWCRENGVYLLHSEYSFNAINAADFVVTKLGSMTVAESWLLNKVAIKWGTDYFTASSVEQYEADPWNVDNDYSLLITAFEEALYGKHDWDGAERDSYLARWGLTPSGASFAVADRIKSTCYDNNYELRTNTDLVSFENAVVQHDLAYGNQKLDAFGNWDKAVFQQDIRDWMARIK